MGRHRGVAGRRIRSAKERDESGSRPERNRNYRRAAALDQERNHIEHGRALYITGHALASGIESGCDTACASFDQSAARFFAEHSEAGRKKGRQNN